MTGRVESERDQNESAFTPTLRALWQSDPSVLAAAFVDHEGECVDYCTSLPPFDAKIIGAHMRVVVAEVVESSKRLDFGDPHELHVLAEGRDVIVRRVTDEYVLVVTVEDGGIGRPVLRAIERAVTALREEGGMDVPPWEPHATPLDVEVRDAVGWPYAPVAFRKRDRRTTVADVLGRWIDEDEGLVCFRIRTGSGAELTLGHDPETDRWMELTDSGG